MVVTRKEQKVGALVYYVMYPDLVVGYMSTLW